MKIDWGKDKTKIFLALNIAAVAILFLILIRVYSTEVQSPCAVVTEKLP